MTSEISRRLAVAELSERILEMAKTGVYRTSIFEAFQPVATKRHISLAIRHAKRFGLHSVAKLRDEDLGTYYQLDAVKYQALQHTMQSVVPLESDEAVLKRMTDAVTTVKLMVMVVGGSAIALFSSGFVCILLGKASLGSGFLTAGATAIALWLLQKNLAKKIV
ncbi:hypothetical protein JOY44_10070 [Phormidium sp. CLA17]|uniref:hypothetical protein n=1 Tax=Leptolyngbya sp. Cla-17 TaxID=2803751 RepID=UPI0014910451|nr:hypothetical protein [Leptolyngbya sp. Cla-17]MBM0741967.1 hypothetical protein [Leptolyngbya sp. Cla-17]